MRASKNIYIYIYIYSWNLCCGICGYQMVAYCRRSCSY